MRNKIQDANILVTGGAGFIGSHLCDALLGEGAAKVIIVDNLFMGSMDNIQHALAEGAVFIKDDIELAGTLDYIFEQHNIDIVFNCATKALNYSFINPSNAYMTNVHMMCHLLEQQRKGAFKTLCHFSTSEVYGTAVYEPMDENHPYCATTTYAAGKAGADVMLRSYVNQYDLDAFIVRPFNNYGPRQATEGPLAGIIPVTAKRIITGGTPEIHGTGQQSRDFIFVKDTIDAVLRLYPVLKKGEAVNISTNGQISINDLVEKIADQLLYKGKILRKPARVADVMCHNASNQKMKSLIDFKPTPFEKGLAETLAFYKAVIAGDNNDSLN